MASIPSAEELAELEKLSANYVPDQKVSPLLLLDLESTFRSDRNVKGDLVGQRISSAALTEEYAKADPIYASKTQVMTTPEVIPDPRRNLTGHFSPRRNCHLPTRNTEPSKVTEIVDFVVSFSH